MNDSLDVTQVIIDTINNIFSSLFSSVDNNLYSILDNITFVDESILSTSYFKSLFGTSASNGILLIANSLILGFLIYYCIKLLLANFGIGQVERPTSFIFKLLFFGIFMNGSLFICDRLLFFNSIISNAVLELGSNLFNTEINFSNVVNLMNSIVHIEENNLNIFSIDGILKSITSIGFLNLSFTYSIRYIMIKAFVFISPFAFLSLCTQSTSSFFRAWFKCFLSLLFIQIFIAFILVITFSIEFNINSLFSKLLICGCIFSLIKANSFIKEFIGGLSTDFSSGLYGLKQIMKG